MPIIKICNHGRNVRKIVKASSVEEILLKGSKLFSSSLKKVVTEKEGCDVDDDEILLEMCGELLMLLGEGEEWQSESHFPSAPLPERDLPDLDVQQVQQVPQPSASSARVSISLPRLSSYVQEMLSKGDVLACFNNLIVECANFYTNQHPISTSFEYQEIGRQLHAKYPCIRFNTGQEPWSLFCEKLSQKIRNMRHKKLRKSISLDSISKIPRLSLVPRRPKGVEEVDNELSTDDYKKHIEEISKEADKVKPSSDHLKLLLKESFVNRRKWIATLPPESWSPLFETFPCFEDMEYVIFEYQLIRNVADLTKERDNMTKLFRIVAESLKQEDLQGTDSERELVLIGSLEKMIGFDKGKGKKSEAVVTVKKNILDKNVEKVAKTASLKAPQLMVFLDDENKLIDAVITGDGQVVFCRTDSILEALLYLMFVYYITDLDYPRIYSQLLGILQKYVINDMFSGTTSTKFHKFVHFLESKWDV